MSIPEVIFTVLLAVIGIALAYVSFGMSQSQKRLMENEAELERRIMEEKFKTQK